MSVCVLASVLVVVVVVVVVLLVIIVILVIVFVAIAFHNSHGEARRSSSHLKKSFWFMAAWLSGRRAQRV